ncbi:MAG: hypothetical protein WBZ45_08590, partial [Acidimicrobiia bacterium]
MRGIVSAGLALILLAACGGGPIGGSTTTTEVSTPSDGPGVDIAAVGTVVEDGRGLVLCPNDASGCPSLPLTGSPLPEVGDQVRLTGHYDGDHLSVSLIEPWEPDVFGPLPPCTGNTNLIQPPEEVSQTLDDVLPEVEDRLAGIWVSDGQLVVGLTGADDAASDEIGAIDGICVVTGYEYTDVVLQSLVTDEIDPWLADRGVYFLNAQEQPIPEPQITYEGDAVDSATVELLTEQYGDLVKVNAFITVIDAPVSDLPAQQPFVPGDIEIPTAGMRFGAGMAALWQGPIEYDEDLNCLY